MRWSDKREGERQVFHSLLADVVFVAVLVVAWLMAFGAQEPPGMPRGTPFAVLAGRVVTATVLTGLLGLLPALVAAALVGGRLA